MPLSVLYFKFEYQFNLNSSEFVDVMKARLERGLKKKRDLGFTQKVGAIFSCGCETYVMPHMPELVLSTLKEIEEAFGQSNK